MLHRFLNSSAAPGPITTRVFLPTTPSIWHWVLTSPHSCLCPLAPYLLAPGSLALGLWPRAPGSQLAPGPWACLMAPAPCPRPLVQTPRSLTPPTSTSPPTPGSSAESCNFNPEMSTFPIEIHRLGSIVISQRCLGSQSNFSIQGCTGEYYTQGPPQDRGDAFDRLLTRVPLVYAAGILVSFRVFTQMTRH